MRLHNIALNNLRRRKARFVFLTLGLVVAISTVVTLITLSTAMNADIANKLDEFGANILITPKSDDLLLSYGGLSISGVSFDVRPLHDSDAVKILTIKNRENISIVAPKLFSAAEIDGRKVLVVGVDFQNEFRLKKWWSITGSRPKNADEVLVGSEVKNKLNLVLNQHIGVNGKLFQVTGILHETGSQDDAIVFIDLNEAQRLFGKPNQLSLIEVAALCYDCPIEEIVAQTSEKLPSAKVMAIRQTIESKMEAMHRFEHFSYGISAVIVLVAALIVMTTITASVNERTREIGVFRAIGFRQTHIMKIILTEAFLTSLMAGVMGFAIGLAVSRFVSPLLTMNGTGHSTVSYALFALSVALAVSVGLLSSIYPAYKASRLDPATALKAL